MAMSGPPVPACQPDQVGTVVGQQFDVRQGFVCRNFGRPSVFQLDRHFHGGVVCSSATGFAGAAGCLTNFGGDGGVQGVAGISFDLFDFLNKTFV